MNKRNINIVSLFVLFEWMPSRRKEVGIPIGILPHVREQDKRSYFPNTKATGNQTWCLAQHQAATWTQADWNSVCPGGTRLCALSLVKPQV